MTFATYKASGVGAADGSRRATRGAGCPGSAVSWRRVTSAVIVSAVAILLPASASATAGDLYARDTAYQVATHTNHSSPFGTTPPEWVVDINANEGDAGRPVHAPEDGAVLLYTVDPGGGWGNSIIWTSADGRERLHVAHLSAVYKTGEVRGGDLIAAAGSTGHSTGPHLHVSRSYDGAPAPVILSGHELVPAWTYNGNQYYSAGPIVASVDDTIPPTTTADVRGTYEGQAVIRLTALDDPGGSGVACTWCALDGAEPTLTTVVSVSDLGTHDIAFWSVDTSGNVEPTRTAAFTVIERVTPPASALTIRTSRSSATIGQTFILSGLANPDPDMIGHNIVVYVKKPGKAYWTYSSRRTVYEGYQSGVAEWWYRYYLDPRKLSSGLVRRGTYLFKAVYEEESFLHSESPEISVVSR